MTYKKKERTVEDKARIFLQNRIRNLNKLIKAIDNKSLGCYVAANCMYYDARSDSCCAVGLLISDSKEMKDAKEKGSSVTHYLDRGCITRGIVYPSLSLGFGAYELKKMQQLHDAAVGPFDHFTKRFEEYIIYLKREATDVKKGNISVVDFYNDRCEDSY